MLFRSKVHITDIPRQLVMTKDNVIINIDSVLYWHVIDPFIAQFNVANIQSALLERTVTTLRATVGANDLQVVIQDRQAIADEIHKIIHETAESWGVIVESILINDLKFTEDLEKTLAAVAKQKRVGESKVISAKAEVQAAKLMREASEILNTPAAIQMRYLEALNTMSRNPNTKVVFTSHATGGIQSLLNTFVIDNVALRSPNT